MKLYFSSGSPIVFAGKALSFESDPNNGPQPPETMTPTLSIPILATSISVLPRYNVQRKEAT